MPGYRYTAVTLEGQERSGVLQSDSARLARVALRELGLFPVEVNAIETDSSINTSKTSGNRLRLQNDALVNITRQLATLLTAELTVERTLNALVEQAENESERQLLAGLRAGVLEGKSLGEALGSYPATFDELYRTLVMAGESSGRLPEVLQRVADHLEAQQALQQKLRLAMIYPVVVMVAAIIILVGLMTYVVPQVVGVFENTKQTLPWLTRALLAASNFLKSTIVIWVVLAAASFFTGKQLLNRPALKLRWHSWLLNVPLIGKFIRARESARLASTLAILVGSGVPMLNALNAGIGVVANVPMRTAVARAEAMVREGSALSRALGASKLFPPVLVHLIESGESSGRLAQTLDTAARQQQNNVELRVGALAALIGPVMIISMGVMVLLIVLAILLPIFELNQLVRR